MNRSFLFIALIAMLLCPLLGRAQVGDFTPADSVAKPTKKPNLVQRFSQWRDRAQTRGFDSGYVAYPVNYRWQAQVYNNMSMDNVFLHMPNVMNLGSCDVFSSTGLHGKASAGLYFRGWGLGFGKSFTRDVPDINLSLSTYGRVLGFELQLAANTSLRSAMRWVLPDTSRWYRPQANNDSTGPENILLELNLYYIFNNRKFSYDAALTQFTWQTKSAGSVVGGLSFHASNINYNNTLFAEFYYADTMEFLTHNLLFGLGYAYNWVYGGGKWMIHASVLPRVRYSYYRHMTLHPMGDMGHWSEDTRNYYYQNKAEMEHYARANTLSLSAMVRLAFLWNISERWVTGLVGTASGYGDGGFTGLSIVTFNWNVYLYGGFRF